MSKEKTIQEEPVARLLKGKNFAFLATLMEDGSPQVTPTWIDIEDEDILINTAEGRLKEKNVSRDPRVALSIVDSQNPYNMVAVRGRVIEHSTGGAEEHIDRMAKKYLGVDRYPNRRPGEKRILLRIKPEKIFHMSAR